MSQYPIQYGPEWVERTKARLQRALQRSGYAVLKRSKRVPQTEEEIAVLESVFIRILQHAEHLGWIADAGSFFE